MDIKELVIRPISSLLYKLMFVDIVLKTDLAFNQNNSAQVTCFSMSRHVNTCLCDNCSCLAVID